MSDKILEQFRTDGMNASYHYACDYGNEWRLGTALEAKCRKLYADNPGLQDEMREISSRFIWSLGQDPDPAQRELR